MKKLIFLEDKTNVINKKLSQIASNEEIQNYISFFKKHNTLENQIDWNLRPEDLKITIDEFIQDFNEKKSLKDNEKEKDKATFNSFIKRNFLFENDEFYFFKIESYEDAKFADSFVCFSGAAKWCIGYEGTSKYFEEYYYGSQSGKSVFVLMVNKNWKELSKNEKLKESEIKFMIQVFLGRQFDNESGKSIPSFAEINIFNAKDEKIIYESIELKNRVSLDNIYNELSDKIKNLLDEESFYKVLEYGKNKLKENFENTIFISDSTDPYLFIEDYLKIKEKNIKGKDNPLIVLSNSDLNLFLTSKGDLKEISNLVFDSNDIYSEYDNKILVLATEPGCKFNNCTFNLDDESLRFFSFEIKNTCSLLNSSINCGSVDLSQWANTEIIIDNCEINTSNIDFLDYSGNCKIINTKIDLNINSKAKKESIDFLVNLGSPIIVLRMEKNDLINFFKNNKVYITQDLLNFADRNNLAVIRLHSNEDIKEKDFKGITIFIDNKEVELLDILNFDKIIDWNGKTQVSFRI